MKRNVKMLMCALAVMGLSTLSAPMGCDQDIVVVTAEANEVETRAYIYEWAYKVMDGHVYKRLYNCTKEEWVGDWILVQ